MAHLSATSADASPVRKSLSLILPAWNEEEAITRAVIEADEALARIVDRYEVIVVDDGSRDATAEIVAKLAAERPNVRLVRHETNQGYGAALRTGFAAAACDLVAFTDADCQFDLRELDRLVLLARDYPVVCGYRIDRQDPWLRCFYSRVYNHIVRFLLGTGVRDVDCAMKVFHRDALPKLPITTSGFLINSEMLSQARLQGMPVVEVGVTHRPRTEGQSTVSIHHIPVVFASLLRYWWNRMQFPAGESPATPGPAAVAPELALHRKLGWAQVALLVVAAAMLFANINYPLLSPDESRYGEIPREMVASDNWVRPQLNYETYYDKPALLYWLGAISFELFGVSNWSARLVAPLSGFLTIAATMWFGTRMFGRLTGLIAGAVLLVSVGFLGVSRMLLIDGLLTLLTTIAMFAAYEAVRGPELKKSWWAVATLATAVAFMAKGPIALVLLGPPVVAFAWLTAGAAQPKIRHWAVMGAAIAALATPWFVAVSQQVPDFAYQFFYQHNVKRFGGAYHAQPIWYFLPVLMIAGHPWTFLTLPVLNYLGTRRNSARERRSPSLGYLALWAGWCLAFFSASKCKLPTYILPAAPALALLAAHYIRHGVTNVQHVAWREYSRRWAPWLSAATSCLGGIGMAIFLLATGAETSTAATITIAFWAALLLIALVAGRRVADPRIAWGASLATMLLMGTYFVHRGIPQHALARNVFDEHARLADYRPAAAMPVATIDDEWSEIPFTLRRDDVRNFRSARGEEFTEFAREHGQVMVVMRTRHEVETVRNLLPAGSQLEVLGEQSAGRVLVATLPGSARVAQAPGGQDETSR